MNFTPASCGSLIGFLAILLWVVFCGLEAVCVSSRFPVRRRSTLKFAVALAVFLGLMSLLVASGWLEAAPMPRLLALFGASNLAAIALALSPLGGRIARELPLGSLVAFQGFRLPLELVLHDWAKAGTIPQTMTWSGSNFDIWTGISALLLAPFAGRFRAAAWLAFLVGSVLLINVARVAVLSSPLPFAWGVEPPLQLAFHLPYAWIVPVCLSGALAGEIILARALLLRRS